MYSVSMATFDIAMADDLDALLDEVDQLISERGSHKTKNRQLVVNGKCIQPIIGPIRSESDVKPCSSLGCIQCDFRVLEWPRSKWAPDTDYLFLRTNMPNRRKLEEKLHSSADSVAYACQCSHFSAQSYQSLLKLPALKWVCRGHQN